MRVRVGCAGWSEDGWVGPFYAPGAPRSEWLRAYARVFDSVEVNSAYHHQPEREVVAGWARATPADFRFTVKLPKTLTYDKRLVDADEEVASFLRALEPLRSSGKLAAVVAVMEPSFQREKHGTNLAAFVATWPKSVPLAVELRHASWWTDATWRLFRDAGVAHVWATTQYGRTPAVLTADWGYARMIGDRALDAIEGFDWSRVVRDQTPELARWAREIRETPTREWFAFVNNHLAGFAPASARDLVELLGLPPLDLTRAGRDERQRGLGEF